MSKPWGRAGVLCFLALASTAGAEEAETITMRGKTFTVWPVEDLRERGFDVPAVPRTQNAAWTYIEAVNAYEELPKSLTEVFAYAYGTDWPAEQAELADYLKLPGNRKAIELARRASAMQRCQMPYFGDSRSSVISILLPNLSGLRMVSKLLIADGKRLEHEGKYDEAIGNYLITMRMGAHVSQGVTLIEGLVGLAVWGIADRAAVDMVLGRPLSAQQLTTLHRQLEAYAPRLPTVQRGLEGERAFGPAVVDELCARPLQLPWRLQGVDSLWIPAPPRPSSEDGWSRLEQRIGQLILPDRAVKRHMLGYYDEVLKRAQSGPRAAAKSDFDEERYLTEIIPRWDVLSRIMLPSLSRATLLGHRAKVELAALRIIVAIRLYMLEHYGAIPSSLDELNTRLPDHAMLDPFSDDPLVYRPGDSGWLLYSVGPDLVDDGGKKGPSWDTLDIVYRFPPELIEPFVVDGKSD